MSVKKFGYARVSTADQNHELQIKALEDYGCDEIYVDTVSGKAKVKPERDKLLSKLRAGDEVVVWKLDRFSRKSADMVAKVETIKELGAKFISITENVDTSVPSGDLFLMIYIGVASQELKNISDRTKARLEVAKANGVKLGPKFKTMEDQDLMILTLLSAGNMTAKAIGEQFGVSRATVYRIRDRYPNFVPPVQTDLQEFC